MAKKDITPLPEGFVDAFSATAAKHGVERPDIQSDTKLMEQRLEIVNSKMRSARQNGVTAGLKALNEEKNRLGVSLKEAMSAKERALAKADKEAQPKDKVTLPKAPWDVKKEEKSITEAPSAKERALAKADKEAQPKDKVTLPKAPWDVKKEETELKEKLAPHIIRGDSYDGVPDRVVAQAKEIVKKMNLDRSDKKQEAMTKALSDLGWEITVAGKYVKEALDPIGKEDDDIDNDGDTDKSDKYLAKRRAAISKSLKKEEVQIEEAVKSKNMIYVGKPDDYTDDPWKHEVYIDGKKVSSGGEGPFKLDGKNFQSVDAFVRALSKKYNVPENSFDLYNFDDNGKNPKLYASGFKPRTNVKEEADLKKN